MMTDIKALVDRLEGEHGGPAHRLGDLVDEAAAALRDLTEWRDIATAPKDGTWVLLKDEYSPATIGQWAHNDDTTYPWRVFDGADECNAWVACRPCYWLPLPSAPNLKETGG